MQNHAIGKGQSVDFPILRIVGDELVVRFIKLGCKLEEFFDKVLILFPV